MMVGRPVGGAAAARRSAGQEEVLRVEGLSRAGAFRDVTFALRRGEILGFAGLVGAGRTEMARALFGADRAGRRPGGARGPAHAGSVRRGRQ